MSKRQELAQRLFDFIEETGVFTGPITELFERTGRGRGSHYQIIAMVPRHQDVSVRVYGERFILIVASGVYKVTRKCADEAEALSVIEEIATNHGYKPQ